MIQLFGKIIFRIFLTTAIVFLVFGGLAVAGMYKIYSVNAAETELVFGTDDFDQACVLNDSAPDDGLLVRIIPNENSVIQEIELTLTRSASQVGDLYIYEYNAGIPNAFAYIQANDVKTAPVGQATSTRAVFDKDIYVTHGVPQEFIIFNSDGSGQYAIQYKNGTFDPIYNNEENNLTCITDRNFLFRTGSTPVGGFYGYKQLPQRYLTALIPTVYATTTCEFVTNGATTTTACSDSFVKGQNETQDIAFGLLIFIFTFFGLLFYFKKGRR